MEQLRKKALRDITLYSVKEQRPTLLPTIPLSVTLGGFKRLYPNLKPFKPAASKLALHNYIHMLAHRAPTNMHHSKRTTPGEVTTTGPHFHPFTTTRSAHMGEQSGLEKSREIARKILKEQPIKIHKRAA